jgi:6-phosphogluconolactonase/glucosamine-6-phosphate isomerase/deaminase
LWYDDRAANSRLATTINGVNSTYYLHNGFVLATTAGSGPKQTIDVLVNRNQGGNPFKPFGTWSITF